MTYEYGFPALSDPTRRQVYELLRSGPRAVNEIARDMPVSRPAVSQHLKALEMARLVRATRAGTRRLYEIDATGLAVMRIYLDSFWEVALQNFKRHVEENHER